MTPNEHKYFYLPAWTACSRACQWNTQAGITGPGRATESKEDAALLAQVTTYATQIAGRAHRKLLTDDFRKASHIVALKREKSSKQFTNRECDRVVDLFNIMAAPLNIEAMLDWGDWTRRPKRGLIAAVQRKAPEALWTKLMRDLFHATDITRLNLTDLARLCSRLNQLNVTWHRPGSTCASHVPAGAPARRSSVAEPNPNPF